MIDMDALYSVLRDRSTAKGHAEEAKKEVERAKKLLATATLKLEFADAEVAAQDDRAEAVIAGKSVMPRPVRVYGQS